MKRYLLACLLPPASVMWSTGSLSSLIVNLVLMPFGIVPAMLHAAWHISKLNEAELQIWAARHLHGVDEPRPSRRMPFIIGAPLGVCIAFPLWFGVLSLRPAAATLAEPAAVPTAKANAEKEAAIKLEIIPGLYSPAVQQLLEPRGFETAKTGGRVQVQFVSRRTDDSADITVTTYCPASNVSSVAVITAMFLNQGAESETNAKASKLLPLIADLKYSGAEPGEASKWVLSHIGQNAEKIFGCVKMQLFANAPRARLLRISAASREEIETAEKSQRSSSTKPVDPRVKSAKLPTVGLTYFDVEWDHGAPVIKDRSSGWATWPNFRARFVDGKAVEVQAR